MALFCFLGVVFLLSPEPVSSAHKLFGTCVSASCGNVSDISYPFWIQGKHSPICGYPGFMITCEKDEPILRISDFDFIIRHIYYGKQTFSAATKGWINDANCPHSMRNISFNSPSFAALESNLNLLFFFNCSRRVQSDPIPCLSNRTHFSFAILNSTGSFSRHDYLVLSLACSSSACVPVMTDYRPQENYEKLLEVGFLLNWTAPRCDRCLNSGGQCGYYENEFKCFCADRPHLVKCNGKNHRVKIYIGGIVGGSAVLIFIVAFVTWCYRKKLYASASSNLIPRAMSLDPCLKADLEYSSGLYGTQFFDYKELEEATSNFDSSEELGDGGFGIVYKGKLRDGRNVAVKRLFESNFRRVEQFKNEIRILSHLRHQNLVMLYGCSSRHSRELLLVYEFIPNGTLADHLHGDQAKPGALSWPTRMSIAIETADALKYLHAVDIIHRDVKTNNILLDNNFHVKVADFGLSRLFPTNVTHVSTAPQGTPGYVDPDYHRCYQLTEKSDVYSFGVVLIELISSKPAVDITRHRQEINLANLAINKIHNSALRELVDPHIGFDSDCSINRMITSVSELAFRCLQDEKDIRPSMVEVLETLKEIGKEKYAVEELDEVNTQEDAESLMKKTHPLPPEADTDTDIHTVEKVEGLDAQGDTEVLLKKMPPSSPVSVADKWESRSTTPNTSA